MTNVATAGTDVRRRVRNAFTLLWGGLFAAAIGWLAIRQPVSNRIVRTGSEKSACGKLHAMYLRRKAVVPASAL